MAYPDKKLGYKEVSTVKWAVLRRILGTAKDTKASSERDKAVIFNCSDEQTAEWLISLTIEGGLLEAVDLHCDSMSQAASSHEAHRKS